MPKGGKLYDDEDLEDWEDEEEDDSEGDEADAWDEPPPKPNQQVLGLACACAAVFVKQCSRSA